jgi:glycerophosphoryl diester phosphodiesterase
MCEYRHRTSEFVLTPEGPAIPAPPVLPSVIGHRGAAGCGPENTLGGLRRAAALGCRWVEFDVRLTADREPILLHDDRLDRTSDGQGAVARLPLAAIRQYDAGSWFSPDFAGEAIPTLFETVAILAEFGLGANVELKAGRASAAETGKVAAGALARFWPAHLPAPLISSFSAEALLAAQREAPQIARGLLCRSIPRDWRERAENLGCVSLHADQRRLSPAIVAKIRASGYSVLAYTVNEPARADALLTWGVTSVFSDVPHIILAALGGGSLPQTIAATAGATALSRQGIVR